MARRPNRSSAPRQRSRKGKQEKKSPVLYIVIAVCALALIGGGLYFLLRDTGSYTFQRSDLDAYIEVTENDNVLGDGASVYVDMSDGMNSAYATVDSKKILEAITNKLAGDQAIKFFGLANEEITPLEMSHTQLYNYILSPQSYDKQKAPIQKTLETILEKRQPALLMSDFEEYKDGHIQLAAYAKETFTKWLELGYNITFYKWGFEENGKSKQMFLAVFDDNANRLNALVETAVKTTSPGIATYVLGSRDFAYPTSAAYPSLVKGGNYHNSKEEDAVTAVIEKGDKDSYISYAKPYASATGAPGEFASLDHALGTFAEYYPLGVTWTAAIQNAKNMKEAGVKPEDKFTHLLSKLYIDFAAQNGFNIQNIEVRTFDMQATMAAINKAGKKANKEKIEAVEKPEINMILTASMKPEANLGNGWNEIFVDFDGKFDGKFMNNVPSTNLLRANIVISKATPNTEEAIEFFSWDGNQSLANSVVNTLQAASSNPEGRILYTYYLKTISED